MLAVAVLGRQPLHQLVHEVAVMHGEAAVDRVQRVRHAQGVHLAPAPTQSTSDRDVAAQVPVRESHVQCMVKHNIASSW